MENWRMTVRMSKPAIAARPAARHTPIRFSFSPGPILSTLTLEYARRLNPSE